MAITGFTITVGTPGTGSGLIIRNAMAAGLSVSWTVGTLLTFSSGVTEFTAFALTHASGPEILCVVGEGSSSSGTNCIASVARTDNNQVGASTARQLWFAVQNVTGSGSSFSNGLYVDGLSPFDTLFWGNIEVKTKAYSLETYQSGRTGVDLAIMEDDSASVCLLQVVGRTTTASHSNSRSVLQLGECSELVGLAVGNQFEQPKALIVGWQAEANSSGNDLQKKLVVAANSDGTEYASSLTTDDPCDLAGGTDGQDVTRLLTVGNDPDAGGDSHAQPILVLNKYGRFAGRIKKRIALSLRDAQTIKVIKSTSGGDDYYIPMDGLAVAWNATDVASF